MAKQPKITDAEDGSATRMPTEEQARELYPATFAALDAFRAANPKAGSASLEVTTMVDGFRRAGLAHHGTAVYPVEELSPAQVEAILTEPLLAVRLVAVEVAAAGAATAD